MKPARSQVQFLGGVVLWIVILQGVMLWHLQIPFLFVCNSNGAWPLSHLPVLGNAALVLLLALGLCYWAWKSIGNTQKVRNISFEALAWALVVGSGFSHALERLTSDCVLDYWQLTLFGKTVHFNLGDLALTVGVLFLMRAWLWAYRRKS